MKAGKTTEPGLAIDPDGLYSMMGSIQERIRVTTVPRAGPSVALFNSINSTNLGDAVIADSIRYLVGQINPAIRLRTIDLAHRAHPMYQDSTTQRLSSARRAHRALRTWNRSYEAAANYLGWNLIRRKPIASSWEQELAGCQFILVGGGQLLMDNNLHFPTKLATLADVSERLALPVAYYACGVGDSFSRTGRRLLRRAVRSSSVVYLRDPASLRTFKAVLSPPGLRSHLTSDPALWSREAYSVRRHTRSRTIGIGIMGPRALRGYVGPSPLAPAELRTYWIDVVTALAAAGRDVQLFTNGDPDDYSFAQEVVHTIRTRAHRPSCPPNLAPRPIEPSALIECIASFSAIICHRLHASIIGQSLGIPTVSLEWDKKVASFYESLGNPQLVVNPRRTPPASSVSLILKAEEAGVNHDQIANLKSLSLQTLGDILRFHGAAPLANSQE